MNDYAECFEYLLALGFPRSFCEKVCKRYENRKDIEGLIDYILICEEMVDSCVD